METRTFKVDGMSCGGCVKSVSGVLSAVAGVGKVDVSLERAEAVVSYDPARTGPQEFKRVLDDAGFELTA